MWPVLETDIGPCSVPRVFANRLERLSFPVPLTDLGEQEAVIMAKAEHEMTIKEQAKFTGVLTSCSSPVFCFAYMSVSSLLSQALEKSSAVIKIL